MTPTPTPLSLEEVLAKYGTVDYESTEILHASDEARRTAIGTRYDGQGGVQRSPHPETAKIGRVSETEPPPKIAVDQSDLIVVGRVLGVTSHLSNDRGGVYSEFKVSVDQVLKGPSSADDLIYIDRAGGVVRYPHGQRVIYEDSDYRLPEVGREYLFFLKADKSGGSFPILNGYELQESTTIRLEGPWVTNKQIGKSELISNVEEKLESKHSAPGEGRKP